jgi:hypothetical protein
MNTCLMIVSTSLFLSAQMPSRTPTANELLDKYTQALDSLRSTITKAEVRHEYELAFSRDWPEQFYRGMSDKGTRYERTEFRTDGTRLHSRVYTWGHIAPQWPNVPEKEAHYNCVNASKDSFYQNNANLNPSSRGLVGQFKAHEYKCRETEAKVTGYPLQGDERLDAVLRRAKSVSVRPKTERFGDGDCYVIDADTDHGRISVWIDRTHGYHMAKMQVQEKAGDLYWGTPFQSGQTLDSSVEITRFEKVNGVWVPMDADIRLDKHLGPGTYTIEKTRYRRTEVLVNPDHDALGSFDNPLDHPQNDPQLRNGTHVFLRDDPTEYLWQDGKLIPDESRRRSMQRRPPPRK